MRPFFFIFLCSFNDNPMTPRIILSFFLLCFFSIEPSAQVLHDSSQGLPAFAEYDSEQNNGKPFLVNTRLFEFDSSVLNPWIEGITHLRVFGVDFRAGKDSEGLYKYVNEDKVDDLVSFCKMKNLKVVWTLNVTSFTLVKELSYVKSLIQRGLNIVAFEYGGEFYLKKYALGNLSSKGVVERIRMDGENRDYLDLLDMWLPPFMEEFPANEYEHILVTASASKEKSKTMNYRREFNRKVFNYVKGQPELFGKINFSYHIYAGAKPDSYNNDEENVLTPEKVDWSFLNEKPEGSRWVVTESGYYVRDFSAFELEQAKKFYTKQYQKLGSKGLIGVHTLYIPTNNQNPLSMYDPNGITPVGEMIDSWLKKRDSNGEMEDTDAPDSSSHPEPPSKPEPTGSGSTDSPDQKVTLEKIHPEYSGGFQWVNFNHTLTFSNGKAYKRSYWFSSPDFSKDDIGKPISYFKKVIKSK